MDLQDWITRLYESPGMQMMGHAQRQADLNLGLGWLYYALIRTYRPTHAVVIGSYRGFVPCVIARAMNDNLEKGNVTFIDPSMVDDFWSDPAQVTTHFHNLEVPNITHHLATTQSFVQSLAYQNLPPVGLLFIDGYHTREQARLDLDAFRPLLTPQALILFHDSVRVRSSGLYGHDRRYDHTVKLLMDEFKHTQGCQVLDLPIEDGLTIVRLNSDVPSFQPPPFTPLSRKS